MQSNPSDLFIGKEIKGYKFLEMIGQGSFGRVYKATKKDLKQTFAIKTISLELIKRYNADRFIKTEIEIMRDCPHKNLLGLTEEFNTITHKFLVMKFYREGDLAGFLKKYKKLPEADVIHIMMQILEGFRELHQHKIIHRDFKLANVLIDNGVVIIADFGLAKKGNSTTCTFVGTPLTQAPEVNESRALYDNRVDIWSIGVCFFQLLFGVPPFGKTLSELHDGINNHSGKNLRFPISKDDHISSNCKDLIQRMLEKNPDHRIYWKEIYDHPLFLIPDETEMEYSLKEIDAQEGKNALAQFIQTKNNGQLPVLVKHQDEFITTDDKEDESNAPVNNIPEQRFILDKNFMQIDKRFSHETKLMGYSLKAAQFIKKQSEFIRRNGLLLGYMLVRRTELKMAEMIKNLESKKDVFNMDGFDLFVKEERLDPLLQQLKKDHSSKCESYVRVLQKIVAEEAAKQGRWPEFEKVLSLEYNQINVLEKMMRKLWEELVSDMKVVYFGDEIMESIFQDLARYYICMEASQLMPFWAKGKLFDWNKFVEDFNNLNYQSFCFDLI